MLVHLPPESPRVGARPRVLIRSEIFNVVDLVQSEEWGSVLRMAYNQLHLDGCPYGGTR